MHESSYREMERIFKERFASISGFVLDVGSCIVGSDKRTYKSFIPVGLKYQGCDIVNGQNVDLVMTGEAAIPVESDSFDVVISGQCFEHVERPWLLIKEMARVLKPNGWMVITAPFSWHLHRYPIDCWRFVPDGMKVLFKDAGLNCIAAYILDRDCWGVGTKP